MKRPAAAMMRDAVVGLGSPLLLASLAAGGCDWRKPLPHRPDAGPAVQVMDAQSKPGATAPGASRLPPPSAHSALFLADEHEPNDDPEHAQPLAIGRGVRASLAPPTSMGAGKGGDDYYQIAAPPGASPQLLNLTLTTGPLVDVQLDVYSPTTNGGKAALLWHIDERGPGGGERLAALVLRPGHSLLVRVRGGLTQPKQPAGATAVPPPPAATSLDYQLSLASSAAPLGSELEPNDTYETACPADSSDLSGTLTGRSDEDFFSINLSDALHRRGRSGSDDPAAAGPRAAPGLKTDAILRVEIRSPGTSPALRVWVEPEGGIAAPVPSSADGGADSAGAALKPLTTAVARANGGPVPFDKLRFLGDFAAGRGQSELRLRNLPLPRGSARAFVSVRSAGPIAPTSAGAHPAPGDSRYALRITVEPPLEGAEVEPNDDCDQAMSLPLLTRGSAGTGGQVTQDAQLAGFLWPGDVDCYRIPAKADPASPPRTWTVKLALPGPGADCDASLDIVKAPTVDVLPAPAAPAGGDAASGGKSLNVRARGDVLLRVTSRDRGCAQAPYQLSVTGTSPGSP
jgi:hypothetical protein